MIAHELQAVLGLVSNSLGGDEASARLGALLRKLRGSREQARPALPRVPLSTLLYAEKGY